MGLTCESGQCQVKPVLDLGEECASNSGMCLPLKNDKYVCTKLCAEEAECVPGWTCAAFLGQPEPLCQCEPAGEELCDGQDNDCNGVVDDGPSADSWCQMNQGSGGLVCEGGQCTRGSMCDSCVALKWDKYNCGGCGNACDQGVAEVSLGYSHTCARLTSGAVQCWGLNNDGQLGDGTKLDKLTPTPVVW